MPSWSLSWRDGCFARAYTQRPQAAARIQVLKGKDLVFELAHGPSLLKTKAFGGLLETANHGRRAADQNLDIIGGLGEPFLEFRSVRRNSEPEYSGSNSR